MWEIFTYGGGSYLPEIFTALKMFFSSGEFNSLARLAGAVSILIISSTALTLKSYNPTEWLNYLVRYALVYSALFVPTTTVSIVDRLNPNVSSPQVISDVPWGVGAFAGITSSLGDGLARLYDQFITIPGDQKYEKYGMLFGSTLIVNTFDTRFPDANFAQNMAQFVQNCALPMLARNVITMSQLDVADNVWGVFKSAAPANRFIVYRGENGTEDTIACGGPDGAASKLDLLMPAQTDSGMNTLAGGMFPGLDRTQATAIVAASIGSSMQDLGNISKSSSETIKQAMMINAVRDAMANPPSGTDTASMAVAYAQASAEATQHMNYRVAGAIAAENIPLLRTVIECLLYALFPVAGIMMLLPFGISALGYYLKTLVWINLWPLLYAILNSVMYWYAQAQTSSAAILPDGSTAYTIYNAMNLYSVNTKVTDYAGYLVASIPVLAYYMIQGGSAAGASMVQTIMQPAMSAAASEGSAIAKGNINQGNMSADNVSHHNTGSWKYDTDSVYKSGLGSRRLASGAMIGSSADGTVFGNQGDVKTQLHARLGFSASEAHGYDATKNDSLNASKNEFSKFSKSTAAALEKAANMNATTGEERALKEEAAKTLDALRQYKMSHGYSEKDINQARIHAGVDTGALKLLGMSAGIETSASTANEKSHQYSTEETAKLSQQVTDSLSKIRKLGSSRSDSLGQSLRDSESAERGFDTSLQQASRAEIAEKITSNRSAMSEGDMTSFGFSLLDSAERNRILSINNPIEQERALKSAVTQELDNFVAGGGNDKVQQSFNTWSAGVSQQHYRNTQNNSSYRTEHQIREGANAEMEKYGVGNQGGEVTAFDAALNNKRDETKGRNKGVADLTRKHQDRGGM